MKKSLLLLSLPLVIGTISLSACGNKTYSYNIELDGPNDGAIRIEGTEEGQYEEGYEINIKALITPGSGLIFDGFYIDEKLVSGASSYIFELTADTTIVVKYSEDKTEEPDKPDIPDNPDEPNTPVINPDDIVTNATYQHTWIKDDFNQNAPWFLKILLTITGKQNLKELIELALTEIKDSFSK